MATGEADGGEAGATWRVLLAEQLQLRAAISQADDPAAKAALVERFHSNRATIRRYEAKIVGDNGRRHGRWDHATPAPANRSARATDGHHEPTGEHADATEGYLEVIEERDEEERHGEATAGLPGPRPAARPPRPGPPTFRPGSIAAGALSMAVVVAIPALILWVRGSTASSDEVTATAPPELHHSADELSEVFEVLGLTGIVVEADAAAIRLKGAVATEEEKRAALRAAASLADDVDVDASALVVAETAIGRADEREGSPSPAGDDLDGERATVQRELDRLLAANPLVFAQGRSELTEFQSLVLDDVAALLLASDDLQVRVIGMTDELGSDEDNLEISAERAEAVGDYLIAQGVPAERVVIDARGEATASGSDALAGLERRVELRAEAVGAAPSDPAAIRIGLVAPSAATDLAFTQSMVDGLAVVEAERPGVEVEIVDNAFVPDDAEAALRNFADRGFDLVIAHGSQYGTLVAELAASYPDVAFAWGTSGAPSDSPNIYGYTVSADEGGYLLGALAATLSSSGVLGVVAPIEVGDAQLFADGFRAGAVMERPSATVRITYTGSFSDLAFAREAASDHLDAGADALTGTAQLVAAAAVVAAEEDALWFGNQTDQSSLAPAATVASQVYHWEVVLREILADLDSGVRNGRELVADLANGGITIEYNSGYAVPEAIRRRITTIAEGITAGTIITS